MSASLKPKPTTRTDARVHRKMLAAERRRQVARTKAAMEEAKDEAGAPAAQRKAVLDGDGNVVRGPRVMRDGIVFIRSNPVKHLLARSQNKEFPTIRKIHSDVAEKLRTAYEEGGSSITAGTSSYQERASTTPQTGYIADAIIASVTRQRNARIEVQAVKEHMGSLWDALFEFVIVGRDIGSIAAARHWRPEMMTGFIVASLERLVSFYSPPVERRGRIRTARIGEAEPADD
jgi:hypothetical protein